MRFGVVFFSISYILHPNYMEVFFPSADYKHNTITDPQQPQGSVMYS